MSDVFPPFRSTKRRCPEQLLDRLRRESGTETQSLRRSLLRGSRVLVVRAGYPGEAVRRDYYARAHELGVELVLVDSPKQMPVSAELIREGIIRFGMAVDLDAPGSQIPVLETVRKAGPFDGVVTFIEFGLPLAAWLAQELGLPGNSYETVSRGRDKERLRQRARELGLPTPGFCRIGSESDARRAAASLKFPAVLKPVSGLTSVEVHYLPRPDDLLPCYRTTLQRMEQGTNGNPELLEMIRTAGEHMILEEFLNGREYDIDFILVGGECVYASVTDNITHPDWPCVLIRANMPADLSKEDSRKVVEQTVGWTRDLGFEEGVFHVEAKSNRSGELFLLEINARIGGASQYQLNQNVWGVDLVEEQLFSCVGIPNRPPVLEKPRRAFAARYLSAPYGGTVTKDDFVAPLKAGPDGPDLLVCESWVKSGEVVRGTKPGPPDWLGEVTLGAEDLASANARVDALITRLDFRSFIAPDSQTL